MRTDVKERYAEVNGLQIHFFEAGSSERPLVLFLHGFPEPSSMWRPYLEALGTHYHVVAPSMRGYSPSSLPTDKDSYAMPTLVQDVCELVRALGHESAHLVAHDWGGLIAWHCLAHHPKIFLRGVIINAPHPRIFAKLYEDDADQKRRSSYVRLLLLPFSHRILALRDFRLLKKGVFDVSQKPFSAEEKEDYLDLWRKSLKEQILYYKANFARMNDGFSLIGKVTGPVLVLWGMNDANLSQNNLNGLGEWVSDLTLKKYPESSHWLPQEKSKEIIKDVRDFLS